MSLTVLNNIQNNWERGHPCPHLKGENMQYKTNIKTLKRVYAIAKEVGLENIIMGSNEEKEVKFDLKTILNGVFEKDLVNEFCQTVTGETKDFEEVSLAEVESVILGFFDAIKGDLQESSILKAMIVTQQKNKTTPSTT